MTRAAEGSSRDKVAGQHDAYAIPEREALSTGEYHPVRSDALYAVGWLARWGRGILSKCALSVWCALREVEAQQRTSAAAARGRPTRAFPRCTLVTLAQLTQRSETEVRAGLRALQASGLIFWSPRRTLFFGPEAIPEANGERSRFLAHLERTGRADDRVPLSRPLLRSLARHTTHSLFLAASAAAMRCAFLRRDSLHARGSLPATWARELFALAPSTWRQALAELEDRGLVKRQQYRCKHHRWTYGQILDLHGYGSEAHYGVHVGKKSGGGRGNRSRNSGGVLLYNQSPDPEILKNLSDRTSFSNNHPRPPQPSPNAPSRQDLRNRHQLYQQWQQFCAQTPKSNVAIQRAPPHPSLLDFVALAQHALRITAEQGGDAQALFRSNLRYGRFAHIAQCDEQRARALMRKADELDAGELPKQVADLLQGLEQSLREGCAAQDEARSEARVGRPHRRYVTRSAEAVRGAGVRASDREAAEPGIEFEEAHGVELEELARRAAAEARGRGASGLAGRHESGSAGLGAGSSAAWRAVEEVPDLAARLCAVVGGAAYRSWFGRLRVREAAGRWHVEVGEGFTRSWIEGHYGAKLRPLVDAGILRL
jgi:hypothetical protein